MGTRWRPNTCGCELDFVDGPKQPPTHLTRCPEHQADDGLVVWDENRGLNRTLKLLETQGIAPETVLWAFTPRVAPQGRRSLEIDVPGVVGDLETRLDPSDRGHVRLRPLQGIATSLALPPSGGPA